MKKAKSRTRPARRDFLKSDASNTRRKARRQRPGKAAYEKHRYDGTDASEEEAT